jgi:7,8-dihydro-6-hydroxymethylpterin-pyrophosphokinase
LRSSRDGLTPETLLAALKQLERQFGRSDQPVRNAPRELDLDLLVSFQSGAVAPRSNCPICAQRSGLHPGASSQVARFVLPGQQRTVRELSIVSIRTSA